MRWDDVSCLACSRWLHMHAGTDMYVGSGIEVAWPLSCPRQTRGIHLAQLQIPHIPKDVGVQQTTGSAAAVAWAVEAAMTVPWFPPVATDATFQRVTKVLHHKLFSLGELISAAWFP